MENQKDLSMVPDEVDMATTNDSGGSSLETSPTDNSQTTNVLRHKSISSGEWTIGEQCMLEELLSKYASTPKIARYDLISREMKNKTIRDVICRCKWMQKLESAKQRKKHMLSAKRKEKKKAKKSLDKIPSNVRLQPNGLPYQLPIQHNDIDDGISSADIGGVAGDLFQTNAQMFDKVFKNFSTFQITENVNIMHQVRDNIYNLTNLISEMPDQVKDMPPLPVKINEETLIKISLMTDAGSNNPKK